MASSGVCSQLNVVPAGIATPASEFLIALPGLAIISANEALSPTVVTYSRFATGSTTV
ncbi:hypothetical protein [Streptococcus sp. KHUD_014]|uniref:hypothetical protein n=1 Tax=Streptococcus sp. KHUD_014 TaxID=3434353 RepID=UPI003DA5F7D4